MELSGTVISIPAPLSSAPLPVAMTLPEQAMPLKMVTVLPGSVEPTIRG